MANKRTTKNDAWIAYVNGERDRDTLARLGGVTSPTTMHTWEKEFADKLFELQTKDAKINTPHSPSIAGIDVMSEHKKNAQTTHKVLIAARNDIKALPRVTNALLKAIELLDEEDGSETVKNLVMAYCKVSQQRDRLYKHFKDAKATWERDTGLETEMERYKTWKLTQTKIAAASKINSQLENEKSPKQVTMGTAATPVLDVADDDSGSNRDGANALQIFDVTPADDTSVDSISIDAGDDEHDFE